MSPSPERPRPGSRSRLRVQRSQARPFFFMGLVAALLVGVAGGLLLFSGLSTRPEPQALHAAFPEALLGPGEAEILVRLEDPLEHRPLSGQVRVLIEGSGRRKELGLARVEGTAAVPFEVPALKEGGYRLVVQSLGGRREEELSAEVEVDTGNRLSLMTHVRVARPGERVHVMALGRRLHPARPAAAEPWSLALNDPRGNELFRAAGKTDGGGAFAVDLALPSSAQPGRFGVYAEVGGDLLGYREIQVSEEARGLHARPRLSRPYAQAGERFDGMIELFGADGLPLQAGPVQVGVVPVDPDEHAGEAEWVEARPAGPGLFAFSLVLPALEPGRAEPSPLDLEARFQDPGTDLQARMPFRVHLLRAAHRIVLEAPARWVEGLPHKVRLEVLDLDGKPKPARIEALQGGEVVARGEFDGGRGLAMTLVPAGGELLFRAMDPEGRVLCTRGLTLEPPKVLGQDFSLTLEESVLGPGEPLRVQIHSKRTEDRLWVDLLVEGMVTALLPAVVQGGKGSLEIPAERLPGGLFQVRAWRWDPIEIPAFEVSCLCQGPGSAVASVLDPERWANPLGTDGPRGALMAIGAGPLNAQALPAPLAAAVALLPGTFGLNSAGQLQLLRALAFRAPLPPVREELVPAIQESWSAYGPPILAKAYSHTLFGALLSGLAVFLAVGVLAVHWLRSGSRLVLLAVAATGPAALSQPPGAVLPPAPPRHLGWFWLSGEGRRAFPPGAELAPGVGGLKHLGVGGQQAADGTLFMGWAEYEGRPGWEFQAGAKGPLWPGDRAQVPCWVRWNGPGAPGGALQVSADRNAWVELASSGAWQGAFLEPAPGGGSIVGRDQAGVEFPLGVLEVFRPTALETRWSQSVALAGAPRIEVPGAGPGEERLRIELFPGPRGLALSALRGLWSEAAESRLLLQGKMASASWGSLDGVLGWGRFALAALEGPPLAPPEEAELRELAGRTLARAWMELTAFEKPGGGFGSFPEAPRELAATAAALEFLVDASARLPEPHAGAMAARTARVLTLLVREDGSVPADAAMLAMGLWSGHEDGRFYLSALVGAALARFKAKDFLFTGIENHLAARLEGAGSLLERLAAAAACLNWDPAHPLGRSILEKAAAEAAAPRAGLHAWTGAGGERADLLAAGQLAAALAKTGQAPEAAAGLRALLCARLDPDRAWGDPWTSAVCLAALLGAPPEPQPSQPLRLLVAGREVWQGDLERPVQVECPRPSSEPFTVAVEGRADGGLLLLTGCRGVDPWRRPASGPLSISWAPDGAPVKLGKGLACRLAVANTTAETLPRVFIEIAPSAAFMILPERLGRGVRTGELARTEGSSPTRIWLAHLPPRFTRTVALRVLPRVLGTASLPPASAVAVHRPATWTATGPVPLEIQE